MGQDCLPCRLGVLDVEEGEGGALSSRTVVLEQSDRDCPDVMLSLFLRLAELHLGDLVDHGGDDPPRAEQVPAAPGDGMPVAVRAALEHHVFEFSEDQGEGDDCGDNAAGPHPDCRPEHGRSGIVIGFSGAAGDGLLEALANVVEVEGQGHEGGDPNCAPHIAADAATDEAREIQGLQDGLSVSLLMSRSNEQIPVYSIV